MDLFLKIHNTNNSTTAQHKQHKRPKIDKHHETLVPTFLRALLGGGYWFGCGQDRTSADSRSSAKTQIPPKKIIPEPCLNKDIWGRYDFAACDACADHGKNKGDCCDAIYRHSFGRNDDSVDDDDHYHPDTNIWDCGDTGDHCMVGFNFEPKGDCLPGLICVLADPYHGDMGQCQLKEQQGPTPAPAVLPPSMVVP